MSCWRREQDEANHKASEVRQKVGCEIGRSTMNVQGPMGCWWMGWAVHNGSFA